MGRPTRKSKPVQLSMLTLMGGVEIRDAGDPRTAVLRLIEYDQDGNVTRLVIEGAEWQEAEKGDGCPSPQTSETASPDAGGAKDANLGVSQKPPWSQS